MLGKTITVEDGWITMRKGRKKRGSSSFTR